MDLFNLYLKGIGWDSKIVREGFVNLLVYIGAAILILSFMGLLLTILVTGFVFLVGFLGEYLKSVIPVYGNGYMHSIISYIASFFVVISGLTIGLIIPLHISDAIKRGKALSRKETAH